jgi:hypothetical protein
MLSSRAGCTSLASNQGSSLCARMRIAEQEVLWPNWNELRATGGLVGSCLRVRGARVGARPFHHNRECRLAGGRGDGCRRPGIREGLQASSLANGSANGSVGELEGRVAGRRREVEFERAVEKTAEQSKDLEETTV